MVLLHYCILNSIVVLHYCILNSMVVLHYCIFPLRYPTWRWP